MNEPYGVNVTKRLVVPKAEALLFDKRITNTEHHYVELVDYMGGDALIERVATAGHGRSIFPEKPDTQSFMQHLYHKRILEPFKWVQFTFRIQSSIADALHMVYDPHCSVNEYSGRYSEMLDTSFVPSVEYLLARMKTPDRQKAEKAHNIFKEIRAKNYERYKELVDTKGLGLTRELSRTPLDINNDTKFYWKMDLYNLVQFIENKKQRLGNNNTLSTFISRLEEIAMAVAPEAWYVLNTKPDWSVDLTYPKDEEVIDKTPVLSLWPGGETKRAVAPELETLLYVKQKLLDHGAMQAIEYMGWDQRIAEAARVSYGEGTTRKSADKHLIRHLYRHLHTSPFEMNELAFESTVPIFTDPRQAGRHRTLNFHGFMGEILAGAKYFFPDAAELKKADTINKQGRGEELSEEQKLHASKSMHAMYEDELFLVQELRQLGIDEQSIRNGKAVGYYNFTSRTGDVKNLLHYLSLRDDPHAQTEIREQAKIVGRFIQAFSPTAHQAFVDYFQKGMRFSEAEIDALVRLGGIDKVTINLETQFGDAFETNGKRNTEGTEFYKKLKKMRREIH